MLRAGESKDEHYAQDKHRAAESKNERPKQPAALHQSFSVDFPRDKVWAFFGRLDEVTSCLPGASVIAMPSPDRVETKLRVKLGPIVAEFHGTAEAEREPSAYSGVIRGSARDARSSSTTRGEIRYMLTEERRGAATRIDVGIDYTLTGPLAQFGRSGLVQDIAKRMTAAFAGNLEARLRGEGAPAGAQPQHSRSAELKAGSLLMSALWARLKAVLRSVLGR
jgi:carbon-monoxide dehydrogenase small subunit